MTGVWVFVCGPSGAGKDSVMASAERALSENHNIVFSRRLVTRAGQDGSNHDAVSESELLSMLQTGGLQWHWQAHGFHYGIQQRYAADVQAGRLVVVNGSRAHLARLAPSPALRVVQITANAAALAARLAQRGRDTPAAIAERLIRNPGFTDHQADCTISNNAEVEAASRCLVDYLLSLQRATASDSTT